MVSPRERDFSAVLHALGLRNAPRSRRAKKPATGCAIAWSEQQFRVETNSALPFGGCLCRRGAGRFPGSPFGRRHGQELSYRNWFVGAEVLAESSRGVGSRLQTRGCAAAERQCHTGRALSLWLDKVPAVLNFSTGTPTMIACAHWRAFERNHHFASSVEKAKLDVKPLAETGLHLIYLDEFARALPARIVSARVQIFLFAPLVAAVKPPRDQTASGAFTSGSEEFPRRELSHRHPANLRQILATMDSRTRTASSTHCRCFTASVSCRNALGLLRDCYVFSLSARRCITRIPSIFTDRNCTIFSQYEYVPDGYRAGRIRMISAACAIFSPRRKSCRNATSFPPRGTLDCKNHGVRIMEGYGATCRVMTHATRWGGRIGRQMMQLFPRGEKIAQGAES